MHVSAGGRWGERSPGNAPPLSQINRDVLSSWACRPPSRGRHKQKWASCRQTRTTDALLPSLGGSKIRLFTSKCAFPSCSVTLSCSISSPQNLRVFAEQRREEPLDVEGGGVWEGRPCQTGQREAGTSPAEEDEAPDLTALTHSGLLLWSTLRGRSLTRILKEAHLASMCGGVCRYM